MFEGYDFIFDGKSSIGENVKILYTERNAFGTTKGVPDKKHELFKGSRSSRWRTTGISYEEPHQFDFQIMLHNDEALKYDEKNYYVKRNQISRFRHWLFDTTSFKKLQILNEDMRDLYFMCMFIDVEDLQDGGHIIGFRGTMLCDSVGAYEDKTIKKTCTGTTTFNIQCLQDSTMDITPTYEVKVQSTPLEIDVNGENALPLFKYLTDNTKFEGFDSKNPLTKILMTVIAGREKGNDIKWNFTKFLIDREGNIVKRFEPTASLDKVKSAISELL